MALDRQDQGALGAAHLSMNPTALAAQSFLALRATPSSTLHAAAARAILDRIAAATPTFYQGPPLLAGPRSDFGPGMRLDAGGVPYNTDPTPPPLGWDLPNQGRPSGVRPLPDFVPHAGIFPVPLPNTAGPGRRGPLAI